LAKKTTQTKLAEFTLKAVKISDRLFDQFYSTTISDVIYANIGFCLLTLKKREQHFFTASSFSGGD
jgi:hypothetical protein